MVERRDAGQATWLEMAASLVLATLATAVLARVDGPVAEWRWLLVPAVWLAAALVPTALRKAPWASVGIRPEGAASSLLLALAAAAGMGIAVAAFLLGLRYLGLPAPMRPDPEGGWMAWGLYQVLYVGVSEEVYFRGYLQGQLARRLAGGEERRRGAWAAAVASAGVFALVHAVVNGTPEALTVFFPGLVFAWLRMKTGAVWAPILAHGGANIVYAALCRVLLA